MEFGWINLFGAGIIVLIMITGCFSKLFYNLDGEALIKELEEYLQNNEL